MTSDDLPEFTDRQREIWEELPAPSLSTIGDEIGIAGTTVEGHIDRINNKEGYRIGYEDAEWKILEQPDESEETATEDEDVATLPDLSGIEPETDDPSEGDLTKRERYIVHQLQTGATLPELAEDLDERETVIETHLRDLKRDGWQVYIDESAEHVTIEGDHALRSSEHKGTRTRKANRWWELRHNELVREFRNLESPAATLSATENREDWVTHLTDLHAGDYVRGYDDEEIIHETEDLPPLIDYITTKSLNLAEKHGSEYDTAVPLWGGDFVTNSGIYEGQFEHLDAWLDEQVDILHDPLLRQVKAFSEAFPTVHIVAQAGNHGDIRASGSSKQANADLILYKSIRNTVSALQDCGELQNVAFTIGRAGTPTPFELRGGVIHGQLRHGQDRSPQADTSARKKEWLSTLLDSENFGSKFDICWMGHHHVSGRLPWNGPPVIITGSPKPGGEYPRRLGEMVGPNPQKVATCHGVSDDGITGIFPIDTRDYPE